MVKATKRHASGGQEINPLDPRYVSMTGLLARHAHNKDPTPEGPVLG